jgi:hypothetical protein
MIMKQKRIRITLVVLEVFVALGAVAGGIGLLTGAIPASLDGLQGSPFVDYTVPAWSLMVMVGGSMFFAAATILTGREMGVLASASAGLVMMIFEIVEVAVIDHTGGSALVLLVAGPASLSRSGKQTIGTREPGRGGTLDHKEATV